VKASKTYNSIADLLGDEGFLDWFHKKDDAQVLTWNKWMSENEEQAQLAKQAEQVLSVFTGLQTESVSSYQRSLSFERLVKKIISQEKEAIAVSY